MCCTCTLYMLLYICIYRYIYMYTCECCVCVHVMCIENFMYTTLLYLCTSHVYVVFSVLVIWQIVNHQVAYCCSYLLLLCMHVFAELMKQSANMFQSQATRLKRKLWWQNVKLWLILIIIILVILAVIISESHERYMYYKFVYMYILSCTCIHYNCCKYMYTCI